MWSRTAQSGVRPLGIIESDPIADDAFRLEVAIGH